MRIRPNIIADFQPAIFHFEAKKATAWSPLRSPDPDGGRGSMKIAREGLYPVNAPAQLCKLWMGKIKPSEWGTLAEGREGKSLRQLAKEYRVSHEAVRRTLQRTGTFDLI